jgi:hypothetical protein
MRFEQEKTERTEILNSLLLCGSIVWLHYLLAPGKIKRLIPSVTSIAAAMIFSVNPEAFSNNGCTTDAMGRNQVTKS